MGCKGGRIEWAEQAVAAEEGEGDGAGGAGGESRRRRRRMFSRGRWGPAEDSKLMALVDLHGPRNWNRIARYLGTRSGKSCRLRWFNQLDPRINRTAFSEEEEERLLAAHRLFGNRWALISTFFPSRTDNAVKNHWHVVTARMKRQQAADPRRKRMRPSEAVGRPITPTRRHQLPAGAWTPPHERTSEVGQRILDDDAGDKIIRPFIDFLGVGGS